MKTLRIISAALVIAATCGLQAQTAPAKKPVKPAQAVQQPLKPGEQPVAPKIVKKLPEKQQAMYDQMATELQLTAAQKDKYIELVMNRAVSLGEKMKAATTDEEKTAIKKANADEFKANVDKEMGVELGDKIRAWQREFTLKQKAAAAPAPAPAQ